MLSLATQQLLLVVLMFALGAYYIAASIRPSGRFLRFAYWTWLRLLLRRLLGKTQVTLYERVSAAVFGVLMLGVGAWFATFHVG